ncbi:putative RNA-binding protein 15 [Acanthaster planci]|uniref:RNA-binding protein 15 n=1 Tax=Acanthaster planci TaxID=133434 RepID=A0A8B7Z384_ACAPL|nr:putative RNA-binding protein 15 [Acanthaster planci]
MRHQSSKDTPKWTRGSPEVRHSISRDRMSPGNDRYEGRGGNKAGRSRSLEKEERRRDRDGGKRSSRSDHERDGGREPYPGDHRYSGQFDKHDKEPRYSSLRVSNFPSHVSDMAIKDALFHEFKKFGEVNVRVAYSGDERFAFVNYRNSEQARDAKQAKGDRLTLFAKPLRIDSVFRRRSISPDQGYPGRQSQEPMGGRRQQNRNMGRDGPGGRDRDNQYDNRRPYGDTYQSRERERHDRERDLLLLPEDDPKATRTVFVGNLEEGIQDGDLRHAFERYGIVEDVDIKYPPRGQGNPFAFVRFLNLDMAHKAMVSMSGQYIGRNQAKTGYGKLSPTTRLWVGGLGPWVSLGVLEHEFDRFGAIRKIDYFKGDDYAYIQYETLEAAQAAASNMRGFPLGGPNRRLRVDFADPDTGSSRPYAVHSPPRRQLRDDGSGYNNRYNQGRDYRRDYSPTPQYRESGRSDQWQGSDGAGYRGDVNRRAANWQDDNRGDPDWSRRNSDGGAKQFNSRGQDNRRKRQASPGVDFIRDRPSDRGRPFKKRRSPDSGSTGVDRRFDGSFDSPERAAMGNTDTSEYHSRKRYSDDNERRDGDGYRNDRRTSDRGYSSKQESRKSEKYDSLIDLVKYFPQSWQSHIVLKNSAFATAMYFIGGDLSVAENLLPVGGASEESPLRITQRLRLDQPKLDEVGKRITDAGSAGHCLLLSLPGSSQEGIPAGTQLRALRNLVSYLQQKQAAGIISLPVSPGSVKDYGVLHAFPPCEFSQKQLLRYVPGLSADALNEDHLVVVILRGAA